jgi:hypothetical protein
MRGVHLDIQNPAYDPAMGAGSQAGLLWLADLHSDGVELPIADVIERLHRTDDAGFKALDIARLDAPWPMLSILVHDQWAVVYLFTAKDGPALLWEGASRAAPLRFDFKYGEGITPFTNEFIIDLATAKELLSRFASNERWPDEGARWVEL